MAANESDVSPCPTLFLEIEVGGYWTPLRFLHPGDQPGSISDVSGRQRDVYVFECHRGHSAVRRSLGGLDPAVPHERLIAPSAWEVVAKLLPGESYAMNVVTDRGDSARLRLRHEGCPEPSPLDPEGRHQGPQDQQGDGEREVADGRGRGAYQGRTDGHEGHEQDEGTDQGETSTGLPV